MIRVFRTVSNAAVVVGGFFVVLFGVSRMADYGRDHDSYGSDDNGMWDVAHADAPSGGGGGSDSAQGDGADCGSGDSGDCGDCSDSGGADSADSGDCAK